MDQPEACFLWTERYSAKVAHVFVRSSGEDDDVVQMPKANYLLTVEKRTSMSFRIARRALPSPGEMKDKPVSFVV